MTTPPAIEQMLDERYGRRRSPRYRFLAWSLLAVASIAVVVALGWSTVSRTMDAVDVTDTAFAVVDEHSVSISFQVAAPADRPIACALEAQDEEHGVVGWRVVEYPAGDERQRAFTESIPTLAHATTGFVNSCWLP